MVFLSSPAVGMATASAMVWYSDRPTYGPAADAKMRGTSLEPNGLIEGGPWREGCAVSVRAMGNQAGDRPLHLLLRSAPDVEPVDAGPGNISHFIAVGCQAGHDVRSQSIS